MRKTGFEPVSQPWQGRILTTILLPHEVIQRINNLLLKVSNFIKLENKSLKCEFIFAKLKNCHHTPKIMKNKSKKRLSYALIISFFVFGIIFLIITVIQSKEKDRACFDEMCFKITKAIDPATRAKGLMYVEQMDENRGMLFVFEKEDIHSFWMKNTLIPLDMIWLDKDFEVVHIFSNATPCKETCPPIIPSRTAKYVLEINAGLTDKFNIKVGDSAKIYGLS
jgi:uncharacterized protein